MPQQHNLHQNDTALHKMTPTETPAPMNTAPSESRLLTRVEVARELHVSVRTVDNLRDTNAIAHLRVGGAVRFTRAAVEEFIRSRTRPAATVEAAEAAPATAV
jgi:excisionase family DNA binding protein